jgi:hypothetical protein
MKLLITIRVVAVLCSGLMAGLLFGYWMGPSFARAAMTAPQLHSVPADRSHQVSADAAGAVGRGRRGTTRVADHVACSAC